MHEKKGPAGTGLPDGLFHIIPKTIHLFMVPGVGRMLHSSLPIFSCGKGIRKMAHSSRNTSSFDAWLFSTLRIVSFVFLTPRIWQGVMTEWQRRLPTLTEACYAENFDRCKELVEKGVDCNQCGIDGNFPLIAASDKGNVAIVRLLVEQGADINKVNECGETALLTASHHGHVAVVRYLIQQGAGKDKACFLNMTALYYAAQNGHVEVVRYLIDQGCCVNTVDMFGR